MEDLVTLARPPRRAAPALPAALALVLAAAACAPPEEPRAAIRVLDRLDEASHLPAAEVAADEVLLEGAGADRALWRPFPFAEPEGEAAARAAFLASARVEPGGGLVLGAAPGGWLRVLAVDPGTPLALEARVSGGPVALDLVELSALPAADGVADVTELLLRTHTAHHRERGEPARLRVEARTTAETRAVGILCSRQEAAEDPASVTVDEIRLLRPGFRSVLAELPDEIALDRPFAIGSLRVALVSRPVLALAPGEEVAVPVALPEAAATLECHVATAPHALVREGARVRFAIVLSAVEGAPASARFEAELVAGRRSDARWSLLAGEVPRELAGRDVLARFSAEVATDGGPDPLAVAAFGSPRIVPAEPARVGPNVVLVSIDTLRADHLGCYGYERPTSPNIDALAAVARRYTDAWTQGPYTLPSHMSLLSGQFPSVHAVQRPTDRIDPARTRLLAEILAGRGYATGAFTAGGFLLPEFGFARGFDSYCIADPLWNRESRRARGAIEALPTLSTELAESISMESVADWIERHRDESFFLFLHTYAPHEFDPPRAHLAALGLPERGLSEDRHAMELVGIPRTGRRSGVSDEDVARLVDLYDAAIHQADEGVGRLVEALRASGVFEDTVLVLTSDHGKEIGDRGGVAHGHSLYEELLHVPLIARAPGLEPGVDRTPVMLVDVLPTVLDAVGVEPPEGVQGRSLLRPPADRALFAEVDFAARKLALREGPRKTIWSPLGAVVPVKNRVEELTFDLERDPGERDPAPPDPARVERVVAFRDALRALSEELAGSGGGTAELSDEAVARLEALGYLVDEGDD